MLLLLRTTGAKSGQERINPLVFRATYHRGEPVARRHQRGNAALVGAGGCWKRGGMAGHIALSTNTGSLRESREQLASEPSSAPAARQQVVDFLAEEGAFGVLEAAAIVVTELVANAVLHAGGDFIEVVAVLGPRCLRLEVSDESATPPARKLLPASCSFGRGLALVEAMTSRWGVDQEPGHGKRVWAELPR